MPCDPVGFCPRILEKIRHGFVALLYIDTPQERIFVALPIAKPKLRCSQTFDGRPGREPAVAFLPQVHKPSVTAITQHAKRWPLGHCCPQFKHRRLINLIQQAAHFLGGGRLQLFAIEIEGNHLCAITLALYGAQPAPRSGHLGLRVRDEQPVKCSHTRTPDL